MQELDPWDLTSCNHLTASERKSPKKLKPDIVLKEKMKRSQMTSSNGKKVLFKAHRKSLGRHFRYMTGESN